MMQPSVCPTADPASAIWQYKPHPLDAIFAPKTVAVIGATERVGSVGRTVLWNLISHPFGGTVFPVNPQRHSVLGIKAYPTIAAVPEPVDLAIVVTPAATVPGVIGECADVGVKSAIIISAGFKEIGTSGVELEHQILAQAQRGNMRIIGPNCLGVMSPLSGLNASFGNGMAKPGKIGFISQSGALCTAILDWSLRENVGFSAFVSIGSMLDVNWGDLIYYLGDDPQTQSIVIYMESIGDARSFLSAAREVALTKPIIVMKAGHTEAAAKAAASHTGTLAGSDAVLDAAFRRSGVLRVNNISYLFYMAEVLAKQPRPQGPRLTILTNAGGPGVIATDALSLEQGKLTELSPDTYEALNQLLPTHWSHNNPIDVLGDADPDRYAKALEIAAKDPNSDGLLVILTPQAMTDPTQTAEKLQPYTNLGKPILASWMGGADVAMGTQILNQASIPTFPYPDTAARLFNYMWRYSYNLRGIYETPVLPANSDTLDPDRAVVHQIIQTARAAGRTLLTEAESKHLLAAYGIPTVGTLIARTAAEAVDHAATIGYPVVLKLLSETITHKTDVGGVQLNLMDPDAVRRAFATIADNVQYWVEKHAAPSAPPAFLGVTVQPMVRTDGYELIIGSSLDPQFGPVLLFGSGGQLVEVYQDRALALPPLNTTLARRMMEQTRIYKALKGVRGRKPIDLAELEQLMVQFSQLVVEQRWIKEIDINPMLASPEQLIALDARVVLHDPDTQLEQLPQLAIRPYPTQYVVPWTLKDGTPVKIRPIRPEDEPLMVQFHQSLSEESIYLRYAHLVKLSHRITHERLTRICFIDYDRGIALVVDHQHPATRQHEILAVARLTKIQGTDEAEFAMLVSDRYQDQGIGSELLRRLLHIAREENTNSQKPIRRIIADILSENRGMQRVCEKLGFQIHRVLGEDMVQATIDL
ncbi:bifunctional acetate--CoA ligase family protein/GNAT family N-acetyltransferase [Pantanalinema rosaneae CENA516]|uniref:bifunctional acetate--CoA ligase family protein/GNAT family N-acetyltransferase n=1 Tax=Pantanalinema rosaneae TaxID=1620701 RepID=UPI003D6DF57E